MRRLNSIARTELVFVVFAIVGQAQTAPPESPKSFLERTVVFTGSLRVRLESTQGSDFRLTTANVYALTRVRLGVGFRPVPWLRVFGEAADARAEFYKTKPPSLNDNPFDLRQAYIEAGALEGNGVRVRLGRQDMTIGSGRFVAVGDWGDDSKTYDVARGTITSGKFNVEAIASSPVLPDTTV